MSDPITAALGFFVSVSLIVTLVVLVAKACMDRMR